MVVLERDIEMAKARCEGDIRKLKEKHAEEVDTLKKKYEGGRFINFYVDLKRKVKLDNPPVILRPASKGQPARRFYPRQAHTLIPMRITHSYEINFLTEWVLMYTATAGSRVYRYTMVSD